jgi:hypothetical protein
MNPPLRIASLGLIVVAWAWLASPGSAVPACDKDAATADPADKIKPPDGLVVLAKLKAEGVQIYECKVIDPNHRVLRYHWVLKAPAAELKNDGGKKAGKHGDGPAWEDDDGKVIGARPPVGTLPKDGTIPWLLIKADKTEGTGMFAKVTYIQRVDTTGGAAPKQVDEGYAGTELRVPYKATYIFYGPKQ